jgi:TolA-binding protein
VSRRLLVLVKASSHIRRMLSRRAGRSALVVVFLPATLLVAGCAASSGDQQALEDQQQNEELQQKVDELEKQQEEAKQEDLQKQIDDLEAQQEEQPQQPQVVVENRPASAAPSGVVVVSPDVVADTDLATAALDAAISYYQAVEVGDYAYRTSRISPVSPSRSA